MPEHKCYTKDGYLRPPDQYLQHWRLELENDAIRVRFCPFCGERLPLAGEQPVRRGAAIDLIEPIPERFTND